jgi:very-short-patch-repair endonuclease
MAEMHAAVGGRGRVISTEYLGCFVHLEFECNCGNRFWATPANVLKKKRPRWCRVCGRKRVNEIRRLTIDEPREYAVVHAGRLLTEQYESANTPMLWECSFGHQWLGKFASMKAKQGWCPTCADIHRNDSMRFDISVPQEFAKALKGRLVSTVYGSVNEPLLWECELKHLWTTTFDHVKNRGTWCPYCANRVLLDFSVYQAVANDRGGRVMSDRSEYKNSKSILTWECRLGHQWRAACLHVRVNGSWCPTCASGKGERITRRCFEYVFKQPFPNTRPEWLRSSGTKHSQRWQSIDGLCVALKVGFEYDGAQHVRIIAKFGMTQADLEANKVRDARKTRLCAENGFTLIRVPEENPLTEQSILNGVVRAIRANPAAMMIVKAQKLKLPTVVSPELKAAMHDTGTDGTSQLVMLGIVMPIHLQ